MTDAPVQTATWYEVSTFGNKITELMVERETPACLFVTGRWYRGKTTRMTKTREMFPTKLEAERFILHRAALNVANAEIMLRGCRVTYDELCVELAHAIDPAPAP